MSKELATELGKRFIQRRDVKAIQRSDGAWNPVAEPWKMSDLLDHIEGRKTYGHYMVSPDDKCKLFAFDIDLVKEGYWVSLQEDALLNGGQPCNPREIWSNPNHEGWGFLTLQLRCMAEALALKILRVFDGDIPVAIAYSGNKGLHVYGFTGSVLASEARGAALEVLNAFNCFENSKGQNFFRQKYGDYKNIEIEVFPKQDTLDGKQFGNLMALPLGIHRKTSKEKFFVDVKCGYSILQAVDPLSALIAERTPWGDSYDNPT